MPTASEDLISSDVGQHTDRNGSRIVRKFHVYGLTSSPTMWNQAVQTVNAEHPDTVYDQPHAGHPSVAVDEIYTRPFRDARDQCYVYIVYRSVDLLEDLQSPRIQFVGTTRYATTNFNLDGTPIIVSYTNGADMVGEVEMPEAYGILTVDRVEYNNTDNVLAFLHTYNSATWQGQDKGCWWCREISFSKQAYTANGRKTHYEFELNFNTHVQTVAWRNRNGIIPTDIDPVSFGFDSQEGNGWFKPDVFRAMDFNQLNIPSVFTTRRIFGGGWQGL
jgi:hypothetical protein